MNPRSQLKFAQNRMAVVAMVEKHTTLGDNVIPIRYVLEFRPNLRTFRFSGQEKIEVYIRKPTNKIALNALKLKVKDAVVEQGGAEEKARIRLDKKAERVILRLRRKVSGKATISMRFSGIHGDNLGGFYRSSYMVNGRKHYMLTTQFEPTDARMAFPCFDEPEFKATFEVSFIVKRNIDCISNMPATSEVKLRGGMKRVGFPPTPIMSTYLLYMGIGRFERREDSLGKLRISAVTTPGKGHLTSLALNYAKGSIRFYERYFRIKYPLPKLDLIAVPDFAAGAMENWGAITFRETDLLGDVSSSIASKQRIAEVVSHEIAHQWFGDLVTMRWWDDIWLNESFATYMAYKANNAIFPRWELKTQYLLDVIDSALASDQFVSTWPIHVRVNNPGQINAAFEPGISYDKGGSVLNMLEDYAGRRVFRNALHSYLSKYAYSNAEERDLWTSMESEARHERKRVPVLKVASYWINKPGYPVVSVRAGRNAFMLSQSRFCIDSEGLKRSRWPIVIRYIMAGKWGDRRLLMSNASLSIPRSGASWIKLNHRQNGFYRVRYEGKLLDEVGEAIKARKLSDIDAWGVENDLFAFARSGRIDATSYLRFVQDYCFDRGYPLSSSILGHIGWIYSMLYSTYLSSIAERPLVQYSRKVLGRLGYSTRRGERNVDTMLRSAALLSLGIAEDKEAVSIARRLFGRFKAGGSVLDRNLMGAVFRTVLWNGDRSAFEALKERYLKEKFPEDRLRMLASLGFVRDLSLLEEALDFGMSKRVRYQDAIYAIRGAADLYPSARRLIWRWASANWKKLMERYPPGTHMMESFVNGLAMQSDARTRREMVAFFAKKQNVRDDMKRALSKMLARIDTNIKFLKANGVSAD